MSQVLVSVFELNTALTDLARDRNAARAPCIGEVSLHQCHRQPPPINAERTRPRQSTTCTGFDRTQFALCLAPVR
jgi:hypothetical protein